MGVYPSSVGFEAEAPRDALTPQRPLLAVFYR